MPDSENLLVDESNAGRSADNSANSEKPVARPDTSKKIPWPRLARHLNWATIVAFLLALALLTPTVGDFGLTWDEPAYRRSQILSAQWWELVRGIRSWHDVNELLDPLSLLYYWPYGRFGINFHPPLAGQLNLAAYTVFGSWMKDVPARRMASVIEFALTITILFHFLTKRYGAWVGTAAAGSLMFMPRLYGQAHLIDTDTPGLLIWAAASFAFWNGLHEPGGRRWRVAVGILLGLAFIEKMAAVMVLLPLLLWLLADHLPQTFTRPDGRASWIDGAITIGAMLIPLGLAFQQIQILGRQLPTPDATDLFIQRPTSDWPGAILAIPLLVWCVRRFLGWCAPGHRIWGVERPGLETWTAILAFAPLIGWLGNPAWWRETLLRLAHYYALNLDREHSLPRIQIIYFGQIYKFSLPWHNPWVLMGITVPAPILIAAAIGLFWAVSRIRRDRLALYFIVQFLTLPVIRMFPTPAHDGVRLFLPAFLFLAVFAGWGTIAAADVLARSVRHWSRLARPAFSLLVLGFAALALYRIHPYELSFYNEFIGGPRRAWANGFELSYWYDVVTPEVIADLNDKLPRGAALDFFNDRTETSAWVFEELQSLGALRGDIGRASPAPGQFPFVWLLTQDSKAVTFTRLVYAMRPWYSSRPPQLGGAQVFAVADPVAVSRAYALKTLLEDFVPAKVPRQTAPVWVRNHLPWLGRFWGDGLARVEQPVINQEILEWSRTDPAGLLEAARLIAAKRPIGDDKNAKRLVNAMTRKRDQTEMKKLLMKELLNRRPQALIEAVEIINARSAALITVMTRQGYTDPSAIGGYLDLRE